MDIVRLAAKGVPLIMKAGPKIGPKILVPLGAAAAAGVGAFAKGAFDLTKSHADRDKATRGWEDARSELNAVEIETEAFAKEYGELQIRLHDENVNRFADWLERNEAQVKRLKFKKVDGVRVKVPNIPKYVREVRDVSSGAASLVGAIGAGVAAPAAALWGVASFGTAGTGAAITGLHGVAATNATLAWLGGGTVAAGGGGMAAGAAVLGLTATIPVLLVGGFAVGAAGAKAKTRSRNYTADAKVDIERMVASQDLLLAVQAHISELQTVLVRMAQRATAALDLLEALEFDAEQHASEFLQTLQLVQAVKEIVNTPVFGPTSDDLDEASIHIVRKYA